MFFSRFVRASRLSFVTSNLARSSHQELAFLVEAMAGAALTPPGFPTKIRSAFGQEGLGIGKIVGPHVRNSKILFENCWGNCFPYRAFRS